LKSRPMQHSLLITQNRVCHGGGFFGQCLTLAEREISPEEGHPKKKHWNCRKMRFKTTILVHLRFLHKATKQNHEHQATSVRDLCCHPDLQSNQRP